jgi:Tfp pilus assembly protein FimT
VTFASGNPEYKIWTDSNNNDTIDSGEEITKNIQSNYYDVIISSTTNNNIKFSSRGTASPLGETIITLTNSVGSTKVNVSLTGRVKIE